MLLANNGQYQCKSTDNSSKVSHTHYRIWHNEHCHSNECPPVLSQTQQACGQFLTWIVCCTLVTSQDHSKHVYAWVKTAELHQVAAGCQWQVLFLKFMHLNHQVCVTLVSVCQRCGSQEVYCCTVNIGGKDRPTACSIDIHLGHLELYFF